ncbi:Pnap_2097 family protein [Sessilibacter corallicola]|uniref:Pnap_2097 family protein n=1 Tax=Sessilibacter corallicola TaxID=2904075 RepID=UPI001E38EE39|nr:Pnap_2097 family protein [Sessilibacter corallicola]MCE2029391.1 hypothetical protein [Sessilibacter corallicola]
MTNLSLCGLSENWLLKECGHQHWMALANHFNLNLPSFSGELFQSENNATVYAAFISATISNAKLQCIQENDTFEISTELVKAGRSKFYSVQKIKKDNALIAEVELISTLVSRKESGNNQSVYRVNTSDNNQAISESNPALNNRIHELLQLSKSLKVNSLTSWCELSFNSTSEKNKDTPYPYRHQPYQRQSYRYQPCPHSDFNGADFLYFANFQRIADQAEWYYLNLQNKHERNQLWLTHNRQVSYYKNINLGDTLTYALVEGFENSGTKTTKMSVYRESDGDRIADILTQKQQVDAHHYRWTN